MSVATKIIFARADLSIPGATEGASLMANQADAIQRHFFDLLARSQPDVIVLDYSDEPVEGIDTILAHPRPALIFRFCLYATPQILGPRNIGSPEPTTVFQHQ